MSYMALYRKWRPQTFDEVVEQDGVVNILRNAVMQNRIAHAYLFSGTRGTGKTTLAKIFARAVNCLHPQNGNPCNECEICRGILNRQILDVSEIDAASNNGVDNIRAVIDDSAYSSAVARYRVYIIDEVHMLSLAAFNALLKTLEEPPENVIFILATTEPQKLPVTVLSRCQRYEFKRISRDGIVARLKHICTESGIEATDEALGFLAEKADGALRDAISLLDQTAASAEGKIGLAEARAATGSLDREFLWDFAGGILNSDSTLLLRLSNRIFREGRDPSAFLKELIEVLRNMMIVMAVSDPSELIFEDAEGIRQLKKLARGLRVREVGMLIRELSGLDNNLRWAVSRQIVFEAGVLAASDRRWREETASIETRLSELEDRVADIAANGVVLRGSMMAADDDADWAITKAKAEAEARVEETEAAAATAETDAASEAPWAETETAERKAAEETSEPEATATEPNPAAAAPVVEEALAPGTEKSASEPEIVAAAPETDVAESNVPETAKPAPQPSTGARKLTAGEWKSICDEMDHRGQISMLAWYTDSTAQYELPGDKLLVVFDDDMTVSILKKSSAANLKVVNEAISAKFGRKMDQLFALEDEVKKIIDATKPKAVAVSANTAQPTDTAAQPTDAAAQSTDAAPKSPSEQAVDDGFGTAVDYFQKLSGKMNFRVDFTNN